MNGALRLVNTSKDARLETLNGGKFKAKSLLEQWIHIKDTVVLQLATLYKVVPGLILGCGDAGPSVMDG